MYTFIGPPNPTPTLNLPTSDQYKIGSKQIKVQSRVFIAKTDHNLNKIIIKTDSSKMTPHMAATVLSSSVFVLFLFLLRYDVCFLLCFS